MRKKPHVLVIYNEPVLPPEHPDAPSEYDIIETMTDISKMIEDAGFPTRRLGFNHDPGVLLNALRESPPDVVFNLFEGLGDNSLSEISVAGLLEWLGVPFTGAPSFAIALVRDRVRTKYLIHGAGLPTPGFLVVERAPCPAWPHPWPAIVKPACTDCSIGIDQESIVTDQAQLARRVDHTLERFGSPVMIEQYVAGREFHVSFVDESGENPLAPKVVMVPLAEIRFSFQSSRGMWPIYSFTAKWDEQSDEYKSTPLEAPVHLPPEQAERVERVCREAYRLVGLRDYGRVDIRLTADGSPYILEVNPNPFLNSITLIRGLESVGRSLPGMIVDSIRAALARGHRGEA